MGTEKKEQQQIIIKVDNTKHSFENTIFTISQEIIFLNEYRNCLISDLVTGKVDIRGIDISN